MDLISNLGDSARNALASTTYDYAVNIAKEHADDMYEKWLTEDLMEELDDLEEWAVTKAQRLLEFGAKQEREKNKLPPAEALDKAHEKLVENFLAYRGRVR